MVQEKSAALRGMPVGTTHKLNMIKSLSILALAFMMFLAVTGDRAALGASLEESIRRQEDMAEASKREVLRLTEKERALYKDLAEVEDAMDRLYGEVRRKKSELAALEARLAESSVNAGAVEARIAETRDDLAGLLAALWPLHLQEALGRAEPASAWTEADRRFTWMASLYDRAGEKLALLENQEVELEQTIAVQKRLRADAEQKLDEIQKTSDQLLEKKLAFVNRIREVRAERISREQAMENILAAIEELNYRLKLSRGGDFEELKGRLPPPAEGKLASGFGQADGPAGRGLSFSLAKDARVKSIYWGKVVHDDILRGFGRVVIVYHGGDYYSLYAYLSESLTALGREVEKGEPLGVSGFYPAVGGPGLYFELRFKQKAINPEQWLALR